MVVEVVMIVFVIFPAIILHEYAHGWVANKFGDPTAKMAGRLSLNPLRHIDPVGTILVPGVLFILNKLGMNTFIFGWAKPVPVNFLNLRNPKKDMIWVAMAGPIINILLAIIFSFLIKINTYVIITEYLTLAVFINLLLATFNMVPIPPLDGSRLVMGLLPNQYARQYSKLEKYGILIVVALLYLGMFEKVILPLIVIFGHLLGVTFY